MAGPTNPSLANDVLRLITLAGISLRPGRIFAIALLFSPIIIVVALVPSGWMLHGLDVLLDFYYVVGYVGSSLRSLRIPCWDPHTMAGFPLQADMLSAVFYPVTWISAGVSPGTFWTLSVALHLGLAGLFSYRWLSGGLRLIPKAAFMGGLGYMLSGHVISRIDAGHLAYISAYAWMPAILWRLERLLHGWRARRCFLLALTMAMPILSGAAQYAHFALELVALRLVHYLVTDCKRNEDRLKSIATVSGAAVLAALFSAAQILPTLELIPNSQRASLDRYDFMSSYSLPPENLMTLVAPRFFGDMIRLPYWGRWAFHEGCAYAGIGFLVLAGLGLSGSHRQKRLWLGVAAAALLLSLGRYTPLHRLFCWIVPGSGLFRAPARHLAVFSIAISALSAMGVQHLCQGGPTLAKGLRVSAVATGLLSILLGLALLVFLRQSSVADGSWRHILDQMSRSPEPRITMAHSTDADFISASHSQARKSLSLSFIWAATWTLFLAFFLARPAHSRILSAAMLLFAGGELVHFAAGGVRVWHEGSMRWPAPNISLLKDDRLEPFRISSRGPQGRIDLGRCRLEEIDHIGGYDAMMLRSYVELMTAVHGKDASEVTELMMPSRPHPVMDMLGVRRCLVGPNGRPSPGWNLVGALEGEKVYQWNSALPRAYVVHRAVVLPSSEDRLKYLSGREFDPAGEVVLEEGDPRRGAKSDSDTALIQSKGPGEYRIRTQCAAPGLLVLTEAYYPGWIAELDGTRTEILRANHLVQAVQVPEGTHEIHFRYRSRFLVPGLLVGLSSLIASVAVILWERWARWKRSPAVLESSAQGRV